jgi:hypothetical protein
MATQPKRWPTNAEWARTDCISLARKGGNDLLETVDTISDLALLRRITRAIEKFREIERRLAAVGPRDVNG